MRFNPKARLDTSRVSDAGAPAGPAVAAAAASRSRAAPPAAASAA